MRNPAMVIGESMQALQALAKSVETVDLPAKTLGLVHLRASQINGCSMCIDMNARAAKKLGETDERMFSVVAWRESPYFTDAERAALALTEEVTRLADRQDAVPDEVWDEAARHYDERALAALILHIATVNVWNRLNVTTRQVVGSYRWD